jgi:hypothetical protein
MNEIDREHIVTKIVGHARVEGHAAMISTAPRTDQIKRATGRPRREDMSPHLRLAAPGTTLLEMAR